MSTVVHLHPVVTEELMLKVGFQFNDYGFEYDSQQGPRELVTESVSGQEHQRTQLFIKDPHAQWDTATHNLRVRKVFIIPNPSRLFGSNGIAGIRAEIGTAVMWASKQSNQRGVFQGESFTADTDKSAFTVTGEFPTGTLRDKFHLQTILFLKKSGEPAMDERHLAQKPGIILGYLGETTIHLKGNGSMFPIFLLQEEGPLWRLECNWREAREDSFDEENVRIVINESHPDYKLTFSADPNQLTPMMKEIIASALHIIISQVLDEVPLDELEGPETEGGSICAAVQYFIKTFSLDTSSGQNLAVSIRKHLDRKTGGRV